MTALFSPLTIRGLTLPNRIVVSPMCQYSAQRGEPNGWHLIHLGTLAFSGAGLLCIEATAVEPDGRITSSDLGLWDDNTEAAFRPLIGTIRQYSKIPLAIQLAHAGRKASSAVPWGGGQKIPVIAGGWTPDAPSAVPHKDGETIPRALERPGMIRVCEAFAAAARRAVRLGIDAIEIHGAHGYLLHQFLSPISNKRTDAYGGSLENRMRFPLEILDAVRRSVPASKPVGVKVSATDWIDGGWDLEQTIAFAVKLKQHGVDWITASGGGISPLQKMPVGPGYQVPFAQSIKEATGLTTIAVGQITEAQQADEIIATGKADVVALARAMLYDPRWPWHSAARLGATVAAPPQYWRAPPQDHRGLFQETSFGAR